MQESIYKRAHDRANGIYLKVVDMISQEFNMDEDFNGAGLIKRDMSSEGANEYQIFLEMLSGMITANALANMWNNKKGWQDRFSNSEMMRKIKERIGEFTEGYSKEIKDFYDERNERN